MVFLEVLADVVDVFASWRLYLCLTPALIIAYYLNKAYPDAYWPWLISGLLVTSSFVLGVRWDWKASH